mgnify:CR=1 FL=1
MISKCKIKEILRDARAIATHHNERLDIELKCLLEYISTKIAEADAPAPDYLARVIFCPTVTNPNPKGYGEMNLDLRAWVNLEYGVYYELTIREEGSTLVNLETGEEVRRGG